MEDNLKDDVKMARTEAAFREVNEAIAATAARFNADETDFVCECADTDCAHRLTAELDDYEDVRAEPTRFLLAPGHDEPTIERVVERTSKYHVVEKFGPVVASIVQQLDPRAA
jgi:nitrate reductase alpha subunit